MSTQRVFVPAALHAELTEYANLIRVLRTTRTLDLTAHIVRSVDDDAWSLWPLIDCPVPEWTFGDEIKHIAESVVPHDNDNDSDWNLDGMPPTAANLVVFHAAALLTRILNLLADQRPSAPGSMQNRLRPMNWEDVISLLAVSGLVNPTIVARTENRLERIYGPSHTKAIQRLESATSAKTRFSSLASIHEDQLFAPPILDPRACRKHPNATRRSLHPRTKSRAIIDHDMETDLDA